MGDRNFKDNVPGIRFLVTRNERNRSIISEDVARLISPLKINQSEVLPPVMIIVVFNEGPDVDDHGSSMGDL